MSAPPQTFHFLLTAIAMTGAAAQGLAQDARRGQAPAWQAEWALPPGFSLQVDSDGYRFPTVVRFVPEPGPAGGDVLYYVAELGGRILAVTNDRTIHTFADHLLARSPAQELPEGDGETGMAGMCLDPDRGFVYATYTAADSGGVLRNRLVRLRTTPGRFGIRADRIEPLAPVLGRDRSSASHQIGPCAVHEGHLYVAIGDGTQSHASQQLHSTLGKILRLTLEGEPAPGNPFTGRGEAPDVAALLWAVGLRNPFGLRFIGDRLFVADNGPAVDRVVEVRRGENLLWDGSDWSMGANAIMTFTPSPAPVQMDFHVAPQGPFPAAYDQHLFVAMAGLPRTVGQGDRRGAKGVVSLSLDTAQSRLRGVPTTFLRYRGQLPQSVVGLEFGPDGLYIVPLLPLVDGRGAVLRVTSTPGTDHPWLVTEYDDAMRIMARAGCLACHAVGPYRTGAVGPALDGRPLLDRVAARLRSRAYRDTLLALDSSVPAADTLERRLRRAVLARTGEAAVRQWLAAKLAAPRFDNPGSIMPAPGLTPGEAGAVIDWLDADARRADQEAARQVGWRERIPPARHRYTLMALLGGVMVGIGAHRRWRRRVSGPRSGSPGGPGGRRVMAPWLLLPASGALGCGGSAVTAPGPTEAVVLTVRADSPGQEIAGFGGTTLPLVYGGVDYLGSLRSAAIAAAFGEVRLNRGLLSLGVVEAPATAADPWAQRSNDNADPMLLNLAGFNFTGATTLRESVLLPASAHGFAGSEVGPLLNLRGPLDWLRPIRASDYERYLDEAAEHVLAVVQQWQAREGAAPPLLYLVNEPTSGNVELVSSSTQEVVDLVRRIGIRLRNAGYTATRFIVPNEETMSRSRVVAQAILADPQAREFVGAIGFHQYPYGSVYASPRRILETSGLGSPDPAARADLEALRALGAQFGVPLWMTEVTEGPGNSDYAFGAMETVLARAIHVHDLLRYAGASAYFGMLTLWDSRSHAEHFPGGAVPFLTEQSGAVLVDLGAGRIHITSMGHAMGHYARWLGPGARWLESSSEDAQVLVSAFADAGRLVLVVMNAREASRRLTVRVHGAGTTGPVRGEVSAGAGRWQPLETLPPGTNGEVTVTVPPRSVTTVAIPLAP